VKAIFFAMITLAVASFFAILASQLSNVTGGEDASPSRCPRSFGPPGACWRNPCSESRWRRFITYYLVFGTSLALFSPAAGSELALRRVLQAIRENDFRAEALGYRTVVYRTIANCLGAVWRRWPACCIRCGCATPPNTTLDFGS